MISKSRSTNVFGRMLLLALAAVVLMYISFPISRTFDWLWIDFSDIPALIGALAYGPVYGVVIEAIKTLVIFLIRGSFTGGVGELANFIIGATFVATAGSIHSKNITRRNSIFAMITAIVTMTAVAIVANLIVLIPSYQSFAPALRDRGYMLRYVLLGVLPFNIIKGAVVSIVVALLYNRIPGITGIDNEAGKE